jgi:hypothetical protein
MLYRIFFVSVSVMVSVLLLCLCCNHEFSLCICVFGKLLDCAVYCIMVHSLCFLLCVSGSEIILLMKYRRAAILYSIGWFEEKYMVLSVVVGFRNVSVSILVGFRIKSRSKKFNLSLFLCFDYILSLFLVYIRGDKVGVYPLELYKI